MKFGAGPSPALISAVPPKKMSPLSDPRNLRARARHLAAEVADQLAPPAVNIPRMLNHRLATLRSEMTKRDIDACVLFDAVNIRHALGARNMQVFASRNPSSRYAFIPAAGKTTLFEFPTCAHLARGSLADDIRPAVNVSYVSAGNRQSERAKRWGNEVAELIRGRCGKNAKRIGLERADILHARELRSRGFEVVDAQEPVEHARAKKSADEIECVRHSLRVAEAGVAELRGALRPGMTENALWSVLHRAVIRANADYIETRLLSSGARTNPWMQECSDKRIAAGELVGLDTDIVGPFGYYADFSRTFFCGKGKPRKRQRELHKLAREQVSHNIGILRAGMTFREIAERAWRIPDEFVSRRYFVLAHGVGMTGEWPYVLHAADFGDGYDGVLEPMTTLCVESFIAAPDDPEGVKLEEQVLVTDSGCEVLSQSPFDESLDK